MSEEFDAKQLMEAVDGVRELVESKAAEGDVVAREKLDKMTEVAAELEEKHQAAIRKVEAAEEEAKGLNERMSELELSVIDQSKKEADWREGEDYKALQSMVRTQKHAFPAMEEAKTLATDSDVGGGYLVMDEMSNEIIKQITEVSPFIAEARNFTISSKSMGFPVRTGLVSSGNVGERQSAPESQSTYGMVEITAEKKMVEVPYTRELAEDASFDIMAEVTSDAAEEFGRAFGRDSLLGDGNNSMKGLLTNSDLQRVNSGDASNLTIDSLISVRGELKTGYNGTYMWNRRTWANLLTQKDNEGQYLIHPSLAVANPGTFYGDRYVNAIDMPDIAANATPVAYGDFRRGYYVVRRAGMTMIRDEYTGAGEDLIRLIFRMRMGGDTVLPEAIKLIQISA